uniref:Bicaudal C homolog 2 n=1 Tax=Oryzias latipes TaxID=8090 RepID=A0A3P9MAC4_ORYLA
WRQLTGVFLTPLSPLPFPWAQHDKKEKEEAENGGASSAVQKEDTTRPTLDPEWVEERFRIDRKKLETMLYGEGMLCVCVLPQVMRETNTQVKWPSKLKIGAKSKKDPHVKVEGKPADVIEAKKKILEVLETKVNKVTLKMDVAYTEHSHVIGKGGGNIKKVMDATSCHIHFPDSNRHNSAGEKSNQVSIAGPIDGVEDARRMIRDLQPLSLTFDLPVSLVPQALPDAGSPLIQQVVQAFGVSVNFRALPLQPQTQTSFYGNCCTVWGLQGNTAALKEATCILMDLLLGSEVPGGAVSSQLDVTTQQHLFLLGQNGTHFLSIMQQTQTQIILPDLSAPQSPPSLLIQGSPDGVCLARQQLMDCLPVCLMFDMREDGAADPCTLAKMMQNLGVFISVKPKVKQTSKSVVVKGLERNISNIYEARRALLGLDSSEHAKINGVSHDPVLPGGGVTNYWLNMLLQQLCLSEQGSLPVSSTEIGSGGKPRLSPPPGLAPSPEECRSGLRGTDNRPLEKVMNNELLGKTKVLDERCSKQHQGSEPGQKAFNRTSNIIQVSSLKITNWERCSLTVLISVKETNPDFYLKFVLSAMQRKPVVTEVRTPTDTWSGLGFSKSMPAEAVKELRTINRRSYKPYLSTTNNNQQQTGKACNGSNSENWRDRRGSTSLIVSSSPSSPISPPATLSSSTSSFPSFASSMSTNRSDTPRNPSPSVTDDLPELLNQLGLIKYIDVFEQQEIDYQTFLTLSDDDLKEVGVSTFGARRKMLLAISDLNKSKRRLSDAPAVKSGYLEGGASGRLPRIIDVDVAAQRNGW